MGGLSFFLLPGRADLKLHSAAAKSNKIYIFELSASLAFDFQPRGELLGRKVALFVDNAAACAALTRGAARIEVAPMLVNTLFAIAAQRDISIWTKRVPTKVTPADLPSRNRELSFPTDRRQELATFGELFSAFDLSWAFQQTKRTHLFPPVSFANLKWQEMPNRQNPKWRMSIRVTRLAIQAASSHHAKCQPSRIGAIH